MVPEDARLAAPSAGASAGTRVGGASKRGECLSLKFPPFHRIRASFGSPGSPIDERRCCGAPWNKNGGPEILQQAFHA
jgi:hypothetical protein